MTETVTDSRGSQVSFLINKICHMETVIEDLKRVVVLLVEGISKLYAHVANRSTPDSSTHAQTVRVNIAPSSQLTALDIVLPSPAPT